MLMRLLVDAIVLLVVGVLSLVFLGDHPEKEWREK
jgi:hypothetical protein